MIFFLITLALLAGVCIGAQAMWAHVWVECLIAADTRAVCLLMMWRSWRWTRWMCERDTC